MSDEERKQEGSKFTIIDKRSSYMEDTGVKGEQEQTADTPKEEKLTETPKRISLPEIDFSSFIISLSTSTLFYLGEIPYPATNKKEKNLSLAKQTIDIIAMLKEKTKGNLTIEEERFIDNILFDLRMRYVKEAEKG